MSTRSLRVIGALAVVLGVSWLFLGSERASVASGGGAASSAPSDSEALGPRAAASASRSAAVEGAGPAVDTREVGRGAAGAPADQPDAATARPNGEEDERARARARERIDKNVADLTRSLAEAERRGESERARLMRARIGHLRKRRVELDESAPPP